MKVVTYRPDQLRWPQSLSSCQPPAYYVGGQWKTTYAVYPEPCYTHDEAMVVDLIAQCEAVCPLNPEHDAVLALLPHEFIGRNNGYTNCHSLYWRSDRTKWEDDYVDENGEAGKRGGIEHTIAICGKRIPPMPSMTRYLVAHEYGHAAFNHKRWTLGFDDRGADELEKIYMRMRGQPDYSETQETAGLNDWHLQIGEIVANDFRATIMHKETEYWPHLVPTLHRESVVAQWWLAQTRGEMETLMRDYR